MVPPRGSDTSHKCDRVSCGPRMLTRVLTAVSVHFARQVASPRLSPWSHVRSLPSLDFAVRRAQPLGGALVVGVTWQRC